jgi:hypothetical protein
MLTIKQWQQPGRDTRVYNKFDTFKCHKCKVNTSSVSPVSLICCTDDRAFVQYCSNCWDTTEWSCPDCKKNPEDCDVIGCERCGQWSHVGCQINLEDTKDYVCVSCKESSLVHTLVPKMKIECYDLAKNLATTNKKLGEKNEAHKKMVAHVQELRSSLEKTNKKLEVRTKQLRETYDQKESFRKVHEKTLTDLGKTTKAFKLSTECYETQIGEQELELDRANSKVASLATDVMHLAGVDAKFQAKKDELKASKAVLADVHGHYANEISTLKKTFSNKQRSEEQEIIALRDNNKQLLSSNCSLAKSNTKLKLTLQDERAMRTDMMTSLKKTNKRARYIYEQQGERIAALKKARVTIRWNGSMPKKLQERLLLQRYRDAWVKFKCQWQDYFGEIRVRAHYANGPIVYNTLDGFMCGIRKRDNEEK